MIDDFPKIYAARRKIIFMFPFHIPSLSTPTKIAEPQKSVHIPKSMFARFCKDIV